LAHWRKVGCPDDGDVIGVIGGEIETANAFEWQKAVAERHPHIRVIALAKEDQMRRSGW
jgi:hypothetical protein